MRPKTYKPSTIPLAITIILCFSNEVHSFVNPFYIYFKKSASPRIVCDGLQAGQTDCLSCLEVVNCDDPATPIITCTAPNACATTGSGLAYCTSYTNTPCDCANPQQCDPYDSNLLLICSDDGPVDTQDCSALTPAQVCLEGECQEGVVDPLCGTDLDEGWNVLGPNCDVGYYCPTGSTSPPAESTCDAGEYFDPEVGSCAALPVNSCEGCSGYCPDKLDCSYYYVCEAGIALTHQQCPGGACFNSETKICDTSGLCAPDTYTPACPATYICDGLITTTTSDTTTTSTTTTSATTTISTTTTTSDTITESSTTTTTISPGETTTPPFECTEQTAGNYPKEGDCNQSYWSCEQVSPGVWDFKDENCYEDLVFNPSTGICDYASNVEGCSSRHIVQTHSK